VPLLVILGVLAALASGLWFAAPALKAIGNWNLAFFFVGLLSTLMKNLPSGGSATVQIVAFTPKPRLVKMLLTPAAEDLVQVNHAALTATRFLVRPQLGLLASLLITSVPDLKCWILGGEAPAFIRFEGPLYFMGPVWRIDWS